MIAPEWAVGKSLLARQKDTNQGDFAVQTHGALWGAASSSVESRFC
jgi:hypothetical protein